MSRTRRNVPGWTTAKVPDDNGPLSGHAEAVALNYSRGRIGCDLKDDPKRRRAGAWKYVAGCCCNRASKRYLKAKRNRAERRITNGTARSAVLSLSLGD